jgi:hypothetical protein
VARFDLDCLCTTAVKALPPYNLADADVTRLYDECMDALMTRARSGVEAVTEALDSQPRSPHVPTKPAALVSTATALGAYAGGVLYLIGSIYLHAYNNRLVPNHSFTYDFFPTVSALFNWLPMLISSVVILAPAFAARVTVSADLRWTARVVLQHSHSMANLTRMITLVDRRMILGSLRSVPWRHRLGAFCNHVPHMIRRTVRLRFIPRSTRPSLRRRVGYFEYLPIALIASPSPVGIQWLFLIIMTVSGGLLLSIPMFPSSNPALSSMLLAAVLGLLAAMGFVAMRALVIALRERIHVIYTLVLIVGLAFSVISFSATAGAVSADAALQAAPRGTVVLDRGVTVSGTILSSPSSSDVFVKVGDVTYRIDRSSAVSVEMTRERANDEQLRRYVPWW